MKKPIKKVSDKRQAQNKEYSKKSRPFWKGKGCGIKSPECTGKAEGIHHLKGKNTPALLVDERFWMAACNRCNVYVEEHPQWAYERGFKIKRNNKNTEQ
ncbi:hypothetical protein [Chitinophaga sp. sic0106]|uniref:hypothetical protein n=1 Tax=Chitinophaga sp. sic0106 TaxID=2854785 RepID=UPI001C4883E5|nr:hypothetical protein [Chitinophaga sp. sic0106]